MPSRCAMIAVSCAAFAACLASLAQGESTAPRAAGHSRQHASAPANAIVLSNLRVIDGDGGAPHEHADILIQGDKIVAVGVHGELRIPASATITNLAGRTALPGLISNHSHLGLVDGTEANGRNVTRANILRQLRQYEAYGVTTVTSLGLNRAAFYELQPELHRGTLPGADFFGADRGFGVAGGAPPAGMGILDDQVYRPSTVPQVRAEVRDSAKRHPVLLKIWVDDFHGTMPIKMSPLIYRAIIDEAHRDGLRVAAHVYYLADAKGLVSNGIDVLAHGVRDRPVDGDFIRAMKSRGAWYIPTLGLDEAFYIFAEHPEWTQQSVLKQALQPALAAQLDDPAWRSKVLADTQGVEVDKQARETNMKNVKVLYDAGVKIGFGTDSGATPLRIAGFAEHRELRLLTEAGLTPLQAIGIATKNAAALLELHDRGRIAPGLLADLLIVDGDPSTDIAAADAIAEVWHRGKRVAGTLDSFRP